MKPIFAFVMLGALLAGASAQDISLPSPAARLGVDLVGAIQDRAVARTFVKKDLPQADLSTILWAGLGIRRPDAVSSATKANRNVSFSGDNPYINLYLLTDKGTWKYLAEKHSLQLKSGKDSRSAVSRASIPQAAFMILFTVDTAMTPAFLKANPAVFQLMAHATAGFAAQNIALTASALKLSTVIQYTLAPAGAAAAAGLGKQEIPLFILQAGYTGK